MTRHPGFSYDAARKRARFDCYVPGSAGRLRRQRTVFADTRAEALVTLALDRLRHRGGGLQR